MSEIRLSEINSFMNIQNPQDRAPPVEDIIHDQEVPEVLAPSQIHIEAPEVLAPSQIRLDDP